MFPYLFDMIFDINHRVSDFRAAGLRSDRIDLAKHLLCNEIKLLPDLAAALHKLVEFAEMIVESDDLLIDVKLIGKKREFRIKPRLINPGAEQGIDPFFQQLILLL